MCKHMVIGLFVGLILTSAGANENCNKDMLQRCAMDLPVLNSPEISFALTREELDKSCIKLHSGITCIDNYTSACMSRHEQTVFRKIYSGISDGMKELCTPGAYQDEYLKHARCVKIFWSDYEQCSKKYEVTLTHLNDHQKNEQYSTDQRDISTSHEDYLRTVCCSFQEFMSCSEETVQRTCGDEAAVFTSKFLKQMASNIIKNFCYEYRDKECAAPGKASATFQNLQLVLILISGHLALYAGNLVPT
ncbi:uncharacterized protein LOC125233158 isoform X1 [Leguminivora glycinivorella]|uniref:uncharacterized protein LOC125233158 isoform X1 n=2 Tax=Leguminivora glycinivorella TaxID=1035111 RepID=UPI00200DE1D3|nr:uncharacterized protein LOC125233158 isoform X1 [Leguminivora glycinivorella]